MARNGFFTGLDIGTSSIKVLVAEFIDGEMNVIGVSNAKSAGVKDGIIVDIDAAAKAIQKAVAQAEEKAGISIDRVNVSLPANLLQYEPTQGMIPVTSDSKEITEADVQSVVQSALTKSITPEREVITFIPQGFMVDSFKNIQDPRGMMGVRLEIRGLLYTGPRTIIYNLRKTVERAGLKVENMVISPLAMGQSILNEGEREFGATLIDLGGGQTTVGAVTGQNLVYANIYQEGGDYVTKDISKVLRTSYRTAEGLKFNYGIAHTSLANEAEKFQVEVIGEPAPVEVSEHHLAEIISARIAHIFDRVKQDLLLNNYLDLPGGIVLVGGGAILPGVVELAEEVFGVNVKLYVPEEIGIRNPAFAHVISLVEYVGNQSEVALLAQKAVTGDMYLRQKPVEVPGTMMAIPAKTSAPKVVEKPVVPVTEKTTPAPTSAPVEASKPKENSENKFVARAREFFSSMFD